MKLDFAEAVREAEEEQILEACRAMYLDRDSRDYVLARHRKSPCMLDEILAMGGTVRDYVIMRVGARPPSAPLRRRYR